MIVVQFENLTDLNLGGKALSDKGISWQKVDQWAHRSITRDVSWGMPVQKELDPSMINKTLYVWPESLIAPIAFTKTALKEKGLDESKFLDYWTNPENEVYQFIGQTISTFMFSCRQRCGLALKKIPSAYPLKMNYN